MSDTETLKEYHSLKQPLKSVVFVSQCSSEKRNLCMCIDKRSLLLGLAHLARDAERTLC